MAALCRDGDAVLFSDRGLGRGSPFHSHSYLRRTDGSPAVRRGEGTALSLSPDGKWATSRLGTPSRCQRLPTGPGEARPLPSVNLESASVCWFPDGNGLLAPPTDPWLSVRLYASHLLAPRLPATPPLTLS